MSKRIDLTGHKYGRLTVIKQATSIRSPKGNVVTRWYCNCDCGTVDYIVRTNALTSGATTSCGCYMKEKAKEHGHNKKKYNSYEIKDDYIVMYTSKNEPFYIDIDDYDKIKNYCWYFNQDGYLIAFNNRKAYRLSRLIPWDTPVSHNPPHNMRIN